MGFVNILTPPSNCSHSLPQAFCVQYMPPRSAGIESSQISCIDVASEKTCLLLPLDRWSHGTLGYNLWSRKGAIQNLCRCCILQQERKGPPYLWSLYSFSQAHPQASHGWMVWRTHRSAVLWEIAGSIVPWHPSGPLALMVWNSSEHPGTGWGSNQWWTAQTDGWRSTRYPTSHPMPIWTSTALGCWPWSIRLGGDIVRSEARSGVKRKQTIRLLGYNKPPEFCLYSSSGPFSHTPNGVNKDKMKSLTSYPA